MAAIARLRDLDARSWEVAAWRAPFVTPLVLGMIPVSFTLLEKWPLLDPHDLLLTALAVSVNAVAAVLVVALLLRARSPVLRGWAVSIAGATVMVFVGAMAFVAGMSTLVIWRAYSGMFAILLAGGYAFAALVLKGAGSAGPGPVRYVAVMLNTVVLLGALVGLLLGAGSGGLIPFGCFVLVDLLAAGILLAFRGRPRAIGRGMLIAVLSAPWGVVVLIGGYVIGHAILA